MKVYFDCPEKRQIIMLQVNPAAYSATETLNQLKKMMGADVVPIDRHQYAALSKKYAG